LNINYLKTEILGINTIKMVFALTGFSPRPTLKCLEEDPGQKPDGGANGHAKRAERRPDDYTQNSSEKQSKF
jgi:hypothetical protein